MDAALLVAVVGLCSAIGSALGGASVAFFGNNYVATRNLKKEISLKVAEYRLEWINKTRRTILCFHVGRRAS